MPFYIAGFMVCETLDPNNSAGFDFIIQLSRNIKTPIISVSVLISNAVKCLDSAEASVILLMCRSIPIEFHFFRHFKLLRFFI